MRYNKIISSISWNPFAKNEEYEYYDIESITPLNIDIDGSGSVNDLFVSSF